MNFEVVRARVRVGLGFQVSVGGRLKAIGQAGSKLRITSIDPNLT